MLQDNYVMLRRNYDYITLRYGNVLLTCIVGLSGEQLEQQYRVPHIPTTRIVSRKYTKASKLL